MGIPHDTFYAARLGAGSIKEENLNKTKIKETLDSIIEVPTSVVNAFSALGIYSINM